MSVCHFLQGILPVSVVRLRFHHECTSYILYAASGITLWLCPTLYFRRGIHAPSCHCKQDEISMTFVYRCVFGIDLCWNHSRWALRDSFCDQTCGANCYGRREPTDTVAISAGDGAEIKIERKIRKQSHGIISIAICFKVVSECILCDGTKAWKHFIIKCRSRQFCFFFRFFFFKQNMTKHLRHV